LQRRIAIFYFALFGALGVFWPFFSLFLTSRGLSTSAATRVIALYPIMTILAPPLFGLAADAWRARGWLLRAASAGAALAFAGFFVARRELVLLAVVTALFSFARAPLASMTDAQAFDALRRDGGSYGRIRLWGSIGFLVAALAGGELYDRANIDWVMIASLLALGVMAAAAWLIPAAHPHSEPRAWPAWRALLAQRDLWWFLLAVALGQMAGATYDSCFSLHLKALGASGRFTGMAWSIGVVSEIALMALSARFIARIGAERLFVVAVAGGMVRWTGMALVHSPAAILALQPLHGLSFGLYYVAGVTVLRNRAPAEAATAAQGLFASAFSIGSFVGMAAGGTILEQHGPGALFGGAAGVAALAVVASSAHARTAAPAPARAAGSAAGGR
jgi:MFS transporter, PPP family, 3-phenylpropionic acid transporter